MENFAGFAFTLVLQFWLVRYIISRAFQASSSFIRLKLPWGFSLSSICFPSSFMPPQNCYITRDSDKLWWEHNQINSLSFFQASRIVSLSSYLKLEIAFRNSRIFATEYLKIKNIENKAMKKYGKKNMLVKIMHFSRCMMRDLKITQFRHAKRCKSTQCKWELNMPKKWIKSPKITYLKHDKNKKESDEQNIAKCILLVFKNS